MQLFSADAIVNRPQKLLIIGPQLFLCTGQAAQMAQKQKSRTTKSPLMQNWVFRLGLWQSRAHKETLQKLNRTDKKMQGPFKYSQNIGQLMYSWKVGFEVGPLHHQN